jgi:hypothetical protein
VPSGEACDASAAIRWKPLEKSATIPRVFNILKTAAVLVALALVTAAVGSAIQDQPPARGGGQKGKAAPPPPPDPQPGHPTGKLVIWGDLARPCAATPRAASSGDSVLGSA